MRAGSTSGPWLLPREKGLQDMARNEILTVETGSRKGTQSDLEKERDTRR
jgi:hypothetical protein